MFSCTFLDKSLYCNTSFEAQRSSLQFIYKAGCNCLVAHSHMRILQSIVLCSMVIDCVVGFRVEINLSFAVASCKGFRDDMSVYIVGCQLISMSTVTGL